VIPGSRASLVFDALIIGMALAVPLLAYSLRAIRVGRNVAVHRAIQLALGTVIVVFVAIFEVDVRLNGWHELAAPSPYFATTLPPVLAVHVTLASLTFAGWLFMLGHGVRAMRLGREPATARARATHRRIGRATALGTVLTTITGWVFYYMAFVA
jgi:uncharacterized membrane protein YozB (DUF420 family)